MTAAAVSIRRVTGPSEHLDLYTLQEACLPLDRPADVGVGAWWLAYDDDEAIAFAGMYPSVQWDDTVYLVRSGVLRGHRGQGLQKRLIAVRLRAARRDGKRWAVTETAGNPASSNSLIACGFKLFEPSKPWGLKNAVYFRKQLF